MRRFINFSAFILAILIIIFMAIPTKTVNKDSMVYVEHEWDSLENVILGSPNMLSVPQIHKSVLGYGYILNNEKFMKSSAGKPIQLVSPSSYATIVKEADGVSKNLKDKDVKVSRLNPEVLDVSELQYLKYVQQGHNFMYPKDAVIVIGNTVIECSQRVPMRNKERFIARKIFRPLVAEDASIRYISAPIPSPSYPDNGLYIEGSDVLIDGHNIYVGNSGRGSSPQGIKWLQSTLGANYKVYTIDIKDCIHLNSALTLVRPKLAIRVPNYIKSDMPKPLQKWEFIEMSDKDAKNYLASTLVVGPNKVIVDERAETLINELRNRQVDVITVPFSEISSFGGGLGSFYSPIRRKYDKDINTEKIDKDFFINHFNDIVEEVKNFDYATFFANAQVVIVDKFNSIVSMIQNR